MRGYCLLSLPSVLSLPAKVSSLTRALGEGSQSSSKRLFLFKPILFKKNDFGAPF